ncbi:MAG: hypothetical protein ACLSAF_13470 [Intestinimonas sp.]
MLNAYSASSQNSTELVGALSKIAPVYYAWGNHELDYLAAGTSPLEEELVSAGATVLDRAWRDLDIHGTLPEAGRALRLCLRPGRPQLLRSGPDGPGGLPVPDRFSGYRAVHTDALPPPGQLCTG